MCNGEAPQHSVVQRPREGVVCVRTALGSSLGLVGVIQVWASQQCSYYHLAGI
jgi:hypothetical protein